MKRRLGSIWIALVACGLAGCSGAKRAERVPREPNIVRLITFCKNNPWVNLDTAGDPNPEGLRVTCYAVSARTDRGANADGTFRFKLFTISHPQGAEPIGRLVKTCEFDADKAQFYRVSRHVPHLGWPYMFTLDWGDAEVYGREIRVVPEFVRRDGRIISGTPKSFRVPARERPLRLES
jgi:hypothetical protein